MDPCSVKNIFCLNFTGFLLLADGNTTNPKPRPKFKRSGEGSVVKTVITVLCALVAFIIVMTVATLVLLKIKRSEKEKELRGSETNEGR